MVAIRWTEAVRHAGLVGPGLGLGVLAIIAASLPALYKKREEVFREDS